ncbi:MAG: hypothetical protein R3C05_26375 [Pirellulaceae bacterium]
MIRLAMRLTGTTEPSRCQIGDSTIDIEEGKNAGCGMTFGVTTSADRIQLRSRLTRRMLSRALPKCMT